MSSLHRPAVLLAAAALAACSKPGAVEAGRAVVAQAGCRACHSIGGAGGDAGPDLTFVGFRRSPEWLDHWLKDPRAWKTDTLMPNLRLEASDRSAAVAYLSSLKGEDFSASRPWDASDVRRDPVERGRMIYLRAGCAACHGPEGRGGHPNNNVPGGLIPGLDRVSAGYTPEELEERIRKGSRPAKDDPSGPEPLVRMPAWGEVLREDELRDLAAYLLTLRPARAEEAPW